MANTNVNAIRFRINGELISFDRARFAMGTLAPLGVIEQCDGCGQDITASGMVNTKWRLIVCECGHEFPEVK
jgi:hypothetical protein